jgi:hypothetical protein
MKQQCFLKYVLMLSMFLANAVGATTRIAVLDFELNDITSLPNIPAELERTAGLAPLLTEALSGKREYEMVPIASDEQKRANASFGYLFHFHDLAAQLGQRHSADWIIVSQHSKPSFLFSELWVYLVDVKKQAAVARFDIELKGNHDKVSRRSINNLAGKIEAAIGKFTGR